MRRSSGRATLRVEAMEKRWLPSGVTPVLTVPRYDTVVAEVGRDVESGEDGRHRPGGRPIETLATRIPFESGCFAAAWVSDLATFDPNVHGSGQATKALVLADLNRDIAAGVAAGAIRETKGLARTLGTAQSTLDSVRITNTTGFSISATVVLSNTGRSIPMTIANGATATFNFGSATGISCRSPSRGRPARPRRPSTPA